MSKCDTSAGSNNRNFPGPPIFVQDIFTRTASPTKQIPILRIDGIERW